MTTKTPGAQLQTLCDGARRELVLVAPFVKAATLERLLADVPGEVPVRCVTRWRPEEIAAGVCDLEIWPLLRERAGASLSLCSNLHAKFYRGDETCLLGSANLTATALGWNRAPNLELLVELPASHPRLMAFEAQLWLQSTLAAEDVYEQMRVAVQAFLEHQPSAQATPIAETSEQASPDDNTVDNAILWLPRTRFPDALFSSYSGDLDALTSAARDTTFSDLRHLTVPLGLSRRAFDFYVGALLLQEPLIRQIDAFVATPQRFGAVRRLLRSLPSAQSPDFDASRAWQTLMRWLLHFLPDRYELQVPNYSEVFGRRPPIPPTNE